MGVGHFFQYVKTHPGSDFGQHSLIPELWFCGSCMHTFAYDVFLAVAIGIHIGPEIWSIECRTHKDRA